MKDYRISPKAEIDLAEIWHFISCDDPLVANHVIAEMLATLEKLQSQPRMGRLREDLGPNLRAFPHQNYIIVYRVQYDVVVVARIVHAKREIRRVLEEEGID